MFVSFQRNCSVAVVTCLHDFNRYAMALLLCVLIILLISSGVAPLDGICTVKSVLCKKYSFSDFSFFVDCVRNLYD